jgi:hypothetical protein
MDLLASKYKLKDGSVGDYLGAKIEKFQIEGAADPTKHCWAMSSDDYLSRAVKEVERTLAEVDQNLRSKVKTPMTPDYRPELDDRVGRQKGKLLTRACRHPTMCL